MSPQPSNKAAAVIPFAPAVKQRPDEASNIVDKSGRAIVALLEEADPSEPVRTPLQSVGARGSYAQSDDAAISGFRAGPQALVYLIATFTELKSLFTDVPRLPTAAVISTAMLSANMAHSIDVLRLHIG